MKISCFITPHGFGHAAREIAIIQALAQRVPRVEPHLFTTTPKWFFDEIPNAVYHPFRCDLGLVQSCPLYEDLAATVDALDTIMPFPDEQLDRLAEQVAGSTFVLCDVAAMGIAVARRARIPAVLVENFTWDWIYNSYPTPPDRLAEHAAYIRSYIDQADIRIQCEPVCVQRPCDLTIRPASRKTRLSRAEFRQQLDIAADATLLLISMGGVPAQFPFLETLRKLPEYTFLIPGSADAFQRDGNLVRMGHKSRFHHPDMINAADAIICKAGYSTIAEAYNTGTPMGYMLREHFPESPPFGEYIPNAMPSVQIDHRDWDSGRWTAKLPELLRLKRAVRTQPNGADQAADFLLRTF